MTQIRTEIILADWETVVIHEVMDQVVLSITLETGIKAEIRLDDEAMRVLCDTLTSILRRQSDGKFN